uniref:lactonase family protein n=1 Tax=Halomonas sp. TaxID=1486246 RepID=UPI00262AF5BB|nr:beta-propeller fold lactonase family protein [Halomonas sp.]
MKKFLACVLMLASVNAMAREITGGVYVATNDDEENSIIGYKQYSDGTLEEIGKFNTGGKGTGLIKLDGLPYAPEKGEDGMDPLSSSYGLWRSWDNKNVLIANAGDGTVSSLKVQEDLSLKLVDVVDAGDVKPNSIASYHDLVYVSSMGKKKDGPGDGNLKGFTIDEQGDLTPIPNSIRNLTGRPASVEFTPDGKFLAVVEITTGVTHVYSVGSDGLLSDAPVSSINSPQSSKERFFALPIGTKMIPGEGGNSTFLVTEARFIDSNYQPHPSSPESKKKYPFLDLYEGQTGSVTSYNIDETGKISIISPDVLAGSDIWGGQQAVCWITSSRDGKFAWTTNTPTSSISTYSINEDGSIKLSEEIAYHAPSYDEYFLDIDLSADGNYVNTISGNTGTTWVFKINHDDGTLSLVDSYEGSELVHSYGMVTIPYEGDGQE